MNTSRFASFSDGLPPMLGTVLAVRTLIELLILGGAVLVVAGAVLVWVLVFRKPRKRRHNHHHTSAESSSSGKLRESKIAGSRGARRRRGFPRQPTLAETGGLPPVRHPQSAPTDSLPH